MTHSWEDREIAHKIKEHQRLQREEEEKLKMGLKHKPNPEVKHGGIPSDDPVKRVTQ